MSVTRLVVAIGRNVHTCVYCNESAKIIEKQVPNSVQAVSEIQTIGPQEIIIVGNREWATPLGYCLKSAGITPSFQPKPTAKGVRQDMVSFAKLVLKGPRRGRPFPASQLYKPEPEPHPIYRLALEYLQATDEVRRSKHNILAMLAILFPEAVRPSDQELKRDDNGKFLKPVLEPVPPDLWNKGMAIVRERPDPWFLETTDEKVSPEIRELAKESLGRQVPSEVRFHYQSLLKRHLEALQLAEEMKAAAMAKLTDMAITLPVATRLIELFPKSDIAKVLAGLLGWREWNNYRELQHFCGLSVTRVDSKNRDRISRIHPETRQYLYLMYTMVPLGRQLSQVPKTRIVDGQEVKNTHLRVKRIKKLLKALMRYALQSQPWPLPPKP